MAAQDDVSVRIWRPSKQRLDELQLQLGAKLGRRASLAETFDAALADADLAKMLKRVRQAD